MCTSATGVRRSAGRWAGCATLLACATVAAAPEAAQVGPVWPGPALFYPWAFGVGACPAPGACAGWAWDERRPWRRPVAPEPPVFVEHDIWGGSGSPWGYVRRLPPPTPQSQIQPRYRDASTIRPEFDLK
jgi:hypothetical protein